jgi:ferrous iron transport protein A
MDQLGISLLNIPSNKNARIISVSGGTEFLRKLQVMGIRKNQKIKIVSKQPFRGPITIEVSGCQMTLGRGMAKKIMVEVI